MDRLIELAVVEETKHLVPNLPMLVRAVFGNDAYLVDWRRSHGDWATTKLKYGDGLVWMPWLGQLWLIEVEWKEGSNFFDQSRAFAKGKIDGEHLSEELKRSLKEVEGVLDRASRPLQHGHVLDNIVEMTLQNHVKDNYLRPHGWVILGHKGDNIAKLRKDYEDELKARFVGKQHYLLSMTRMFESDVSTYMLLEQYWSEGCEKLVRIPGSLLVPARSAISPTTSAPEPVESKAQPAAKPSPLGQAARCWEYLKSLKPNLTREHVRLRLTIDKKRLHDFDIDWDHAGKELMVFPPNSDIHRKPVAAARTVFGEPFPKPHEIRRTFIDVSETPPQLLATYLEVESHVRKAKSHSKELPVGPTQQAGEETYFDVITVSKRRRIKQNILSRRKLWERFLEKKRLSSGDFKRLSDFKPKAIAGFMNFLQRNKIASRTGDIFVINEAVVPKIRELLSKQPNGS